MAPEIRFCRSFDGVRIAYAQSGRGPALVKAPHWLTHLEHEWQSPVWRPWIEKLSAHYRFTRMDQRGCGLSDRDVEQISLEAWVSDLEAVVDAARLERFVLFGHSQGAVTAMQYAVRHPERVTHLVLLGAYARGTLLRPMAAAGSEEFEAQMKLVEAGWGRDDPAYRQLFAVQLIPGGTLEQLSNIAELQRLSASPATAVRIMRAIASLDAAEVAERLAVPTLALHVSGDRRAPFEEGRLLAGRIPGARFVPLEGKNHIPLAGEPAFDAIIAAIRQFTSEGHRRSAHAFKSLTEREAQVLERMAEGLDNAQIAAHLDLSEKTVRNHITRIFDKLGVESRSQAILAALGRR